MIRALSVVTAGHEAADDRIELDFDQRHRRRIAMTSKSGKEFLLDLQSAVVLRDGDTLALDDGSRVLVTAKLEPVAEIRAASTALLTKVAWHLGNRHLPTQVFDDCLRIRNDHVIVDMVRGLGATVEITDAPFQPEGGAYAKHHEH